MPLTPGQSWLIIKIVSARSIRARVDAIRHQVDINNNLTQREVESLPPNGIGLVELTLTNL